ncbi:MULTISPECIES: hypothetical protein [unclassified Xanthomonas]|uniref:DUF7822 domain-containing protein n=1 Tax=unclassified Xanthomonas TaxID=2643310 RepID=UPI00161CE182|nr:MULTISPECIES: hypothetical protein [unclassified Xanthomonas]MBB4131341.1 hypothetical protein [Xanthomonas sp. 3075]MBB5865181.1 hypothetical protein [Xanthomonas sp. 3058]
MANRSYLYSLSNRPTAYDDRPEMICGLSEWPYDVPFVYRLLMSADPQLCASLVSDGLGDDDEAPGDDDDGHSDGAHAQAGRKTRLYAISSTFDPGMERFRRFVEIVKILVATAAPAMPTPAPAPAPAPVSFTGRLKRMFSAAPSSAELAAQPPGPAPAAVEHLPSWLDESLIFLEERSDDFLLLETVELDLMSEGEEQGLRDCVEAEIDRCRAVGAAFAALPADMHDAAQLVRRAAAQLHAPPLDAFYGLRFDDDCDSTRTGATKHPLGLMNWSEDLYFEVMDREDFEERRANG